jgi:hypothetical protein
MLFAVQLLFVLLRSLPHSFAPAKKVVASTTTHPQPLVFTAVLAKQKAVLLPDWLHNLDVCDYPKERMIVYIRANDCTDGTDQILQKWANRERSAYYHIIEDYSPARQSVAKYGVHEWNSERFKVLGEIRDTSIALATQHNAEFYWVVDVDNFILPSTLSVMVKLNLPIVAPLLHYAEGTAPEDATHTTYSNYHNVATQNGYFQSNEDYMRIWSRSVRGLIECDVVHCTYLIRGDVMPRMRYVDGSDRYEYVSFSDNCRKQNIPQYLDNRQVYGYLSLTEDLSALTTSMAKLGGQALAADTSASHDA